VLKGLKNAEEARFEFQNLFTSLHSANKGFRNDTRVTLDDFKEWHAIINSQVDRDADFRKFIVGVWNMDTKENCDPVVFSGIQNIEIAKKTTGAREMYKHDFHRVTFGSEQILAHPVPMTAIENLDPKIITGGAEARKRPDI
jgi:hypothetical protein